jgi:hypothetical protein
MKSTYNIAALIVFLTLIGCGVIYISDAKPGKQHDICPYSILEIFDGKFCHGTRNGPRYAYTIEDTPKMFWAIIICYTFLFSLLLGGVLFLVLDNPKLLKRAKNENNEIRKQ